MKQLTENLWDNVDEMFPIGSIHAAMVSGIEEFGCFVLFENGFNGLVHRSEMDWFNPRPDTTSIVSVGEKIKVKVLSFDKEQRHLSVGLKQLTENPWDRVGEICPIGSIHKGSVARIEEFGCFVLLENGVRGLIHYSEMDWLNPRPDTTSIVSVGDEIKVKVLSIDKEQMYITFGMKQLTENPWNKVDELCPIGSIHKGTVSGVKDFGCFVLLENGFLGLVHHSEMDWLNRKPETSSIVSEGDEIKVKILSIDKEQMQVDFGMKQLTEYPLDKISEMYPTGSIQEGTVSRIEEFGCFVNLENGFSGLVPASQMDWINRRPKTTSIVSVDEKIKVKVLSFDKEQMQIIMGLKQLTEDPWAKVDEMCPIGSIHKGTVSEVKKLGCVVELENGLLGFLPRSNMNWLDSKPEVSSIFSVGDEIEVKVLNFDKEHRQIRLGIKELTENPWDKLDEMYPIGSIHTGVVTTIEEFGCFVDLKKGFRGLVTAAQIDWLNPRPNITNYVTVGDEIKVKVLSFDKEQMQIKLGIKQLTEDHWDKVDESCPIGSIQEGTVSAIENFGCFVLLENGFLGLVHHSQMDWLNPKPNTASIVSIGEKIKVKVLRVDKEQKHISFGLKQLTKDSWGKVDEMCPIGSIHKGTVSEVKDFGCFVDLENGFFGLVPGSHMDWLNPKPNTASIVSVGEEIKVKVLSVDKEQRHIIFGMKQLTEDPWAKVDEMCPNGSIHKGTVSKIENFGCFVALKNGFFGLVHKSQMDWFNPKPNTASIVSVGEEIKVKVLRVDKEQMQISLSMKELTEDPWAKVDEMYPKGSIQKGTVSEVKDFGCFVELKNGFFGLVHRSHMDWLNPKPVTASIVSVGDEIEVKVLSVDKKQMQMTLGMKQLTENPWELFAKDYKLGDRLSGKIKSVTDFGIFVKLEYGMDALVRVKDISCIQSGVASIKEYSLGDTIEVVILHIDVVQQKIELGIY